MKSMCDYTLYCSEPQTRRAYELGAPIEQYEYNYHVPNDEYSSMIGTKIKPNDDVWYEHLQKPTIEEMRGWLREQNIFINVCHNSGGYGVWLKSIMPSEQIGELIGYYEGEPQAILAGIDTALSYLESKK